MTGPYETMSSRRGQARQVIRVQRVEGRPAAQEVGELPHGQDTRSALVEILAQTAGRVEGEPRQ